MGSHAEIKSVCVGGGGGQGVRTSILKIRKRPYVFLEILVHTPLEKQLGSIASRERSIHHSVKCADEKNNMSQCMRFPTLWYVRPTKPQISLRIRAV